MKLSISLGQMDIAFGEPKTNLGKVQEMTAEARRRGSEVVVFPELWATGFDLARVRDHATPTDEGVFAEVAKLAREQSIHIIGSSLSAQGMEYRNTAVIFSPEGQLLAEYSKLHLFKPMDEHEYLVPGKEAPVFDLAWGRGAMAICYDLRFPELFRNYALRGVKIVFLTAEWPYPRLMHWQVLLRARAIENQFFMAACNRVGESGDWSFFGHSTIIGPSGELMVEAGDEETVLTAELDLDTVVRARELLTVFEDRNERAYRDGEHASNGIGNGLSKHERLV